MAATFTTLYHKIQLQDSWSLISTYITEEDMHVDVLFEREERHVIILKNNLGAAWLPEWDFNGVGEMDFGLGYQIKLDADLEVMFKVLAHQLKQPLTSVKAGTCWAIRAHSLKMPKLHWRPF